MKVAVSELPALQLQRWTEYVAHGNKAADLLEQLGDVLVGVLNGTAAEAGRLTRVAMALHSQATTELERADFAVSVFATLVDAEQRHRRRAWKRAPWPK